MHLCVSAYYLVNSITNRDCARELHDTETETGILQIWDNKEFKTTSLFTLDYQHTVLTSLIAGNHLTVEDIIKRWDTSVHWAPLMTLWRTTFHYS